MAITNTLRSLMGPRRIHVHRPVEVAKRFAMLIGERYGDRVKGVLVHGSAAQGTFRAGSSDINVAIVLDAVTPADILELALHTPSFRDEGLTHPTLFDPAWLRDSLDVYPLEIWEMQRAHEMLIGTDPLVGLAIERPALRDELERELRARWLALQTGWAADAHDRERMKRLLTRSAKTFTVLARGTLYLFGQDTPTLEPPEVTWNRIAALVGSGDGLFDAIRATVAGSGNQTALGGQYFTFLKALIDKVDTWKPTA